MVDMKKMTKSEVLKLIGERLRASRIEKGFTQQEVADLLGVSKYQISKWECGTRDMTRSKLAQYAEVLNVSPVYLLGFDSDKTPHTQKNRTPSNLVDLSKEFKRGILAGDIACGEPINQEEGEEILIPYGADVALFCKGDSMINAGINDGDIVFIRYLDGFDEMINGKIAAVGIGDDYEYTLKRWFYNETKQTLKLVPENDLYKPRIFVGEQLEDVHLLGVAVGFTSIL